MVLYKPNVDGLLGKSTLIKVLVQEVEPDEGCGGIVWKHMNLRVAYVVRGTVEVYIASSY